MRKKEDDFRPRSMALARTPFGRPIEWAARFTFLKTMPLFGSASADLRPKRYGSRSRRPSPKRRCRVFNLIVEAQLVAQNSQVPSTRTPSHWAWSVPFGVVVLVTGISCNKSNTTADRKIDVCGLISREDVQSIQGSSIREIKPNENTNGGFHTTDCSYIGETADQSVTVSVVQKNASSEKAI